MPATASASFTPEPASVGAARRFAAARLQAPTLRHLQDDLRTIVSELATNAVLHARTPFTITVQVDDAQVLVAVTDASSTRPRPPRHGDLAGTTGRGLRIVAQLSADWGVEVREDGKTTWCVLPTFARHRETGRSEDVTGAPAPALLTGATASEAVVPGRPGDGACAAPTPPVRDRRAFAA